MEQYLDAQDLMRVLKISRSTAYALLHRADFPTASIGRKLLVSESALATWMNRGGTVDKGR